MKTMAYDILTVMVVMGIFLTAIGWIANLVKGALAALLPF